MNIMNIFGTDTTPVRKLLALKSTIHGDKNLFKWNVPFQNPDNTGIYNTNKRIFQPKTYCVGNSDTNWFSPNNAGAYSVSDGVVSVTPKSGGYGVTFPIAVVEGNKYKLSFQSTNTSVGLAFYGVDGTYIKGQSRIQSGNVITAAEGATIMTIIFGANVTNEEATYSDILLLPSE